MLNRATCCATASSFTGCTYCAARAAGFLRRTFSMLRRNPLGDSRYRLTSSLISWLAYSVITKYRCCIIMTFIYPNYMYMLLPLSKIFYLSMYFLLLGNAIHIYMQLSHTLKFCGVFNLSSKSKIMVHLPYVGLILTGRTDIPPRLYLGNRTPYWRCPSLHTA